MLETTVYVRNYERVRLQDAAARTGQPRGRIISALMKRLVSEHHRPVRAWTRVKYQVRSADGGSGLHVLFKPDEYELLQDMRKFFKQSISRLVAYAIDAYLDDVIDEINKGTDNYWYSNYAMSRIIIDGVVCWMLYWGIPKKLLTNPRFYVDFCPSSSG